MPFFAFPLNLNFNKDTKIIFWNLHPYNFFGYAARISRFKSKFIQSILYILFRNFIYSNERKAINIFKKHNALFFMDEENLEQTEDLLKVSIKNPIYLPLTLNSGENIKLNHMKGKDNLNCIWIGRIADFKVHILLYTIKRLEKYTIDKDINCTFTIVGDGEYLEYLKDKLKDIHINIVYINYMEEKDISELLKDIDVSFCMGTSALDTAKYGVPTVLLDFTYEEIVQDYKFDWLFNTQNYTLANNITDKNYKKDNQTLEIMMDDIFKDYAKLSNMSFKYILENYDIKQNTKNFINLINNATLTAKDIPNSFYKMNIFHKTLGVRRYYVN